MTQFMCREHEGQNGSHSVIVVGEVVEGVSLGSTLGLKIYICAVSV